MQLKRKILKYMNISYMNIRKYYLQTKANLLDQPSEVSFEITHNCNLRCKHCFLYGGESGFYDCCRGNKPNIWRYLFVMIIAAGFVPMFWLFSLICSIIAFSLYLKACFNDSSNPLSLLIMLIPTDEPESFGFITIGKPTFLIMDS